MEKVNKDPDRFKSDIVADVHFDKMTEYDKKNQDCLDVIDVKVSAMGCDHKISNAAIQAC
jgi:hypothetical protein